MTRTIRHSPSRGPASPDVWGLYEPASGSVQYVLACPATRKAALIDVVQDFDPASASTSTESAEHVLELVANEGLEIEWILDTHPHADHLMAAAFLKGRTGAPMAIGEKVREIAGLWRELYHTPDAFDPGHDFDRLLADGERFAVGEIEVRVMLSPGHTLGSVSYVAGDAALVHDTLMYPDSGSSGRTSRADLGGALGEHPGDPCAAGRHPAVRRGTTTAAGGARSRRGRRRSPSTSRRNVHVRAGTSREAFIARRDERDATLALPDRMLAALQVNLRGGRPPPAESDGHRYLKIPLDRFGRQRPSS